MVDLFLWRLLVALFFFCFCFAIYHQATLSPHLARTLSTSPSSIGFVFIVPNVLYTVMAAKAEDIVDRVGVKKTLLFGLGIMAVGYGYVGV